MPVLFLGHGSPMNAILDNDYRRSWQALGQDLLANYPKPQLILCISAHWVTRGWYLTAMEQPKTIHDFGGFPQELFNQQYPAPGNPAAAREIAANIGAGLDQAEWGLDHGAWGVLKPMFPNADIPVIQLSLDWHAAPAQHFAMGHKLRALRDQGVLVIASGNTVHNLGMMGQGAPYDWNVQFDTFVKNHIEAGSLAELAKFQDLGAVANQAHPNIDHYLPLLHAAGAVDEHDSVRFFNERYDARSLAMRSVIWEART
ncbi:MAG: 4,5-DOPA dioxygenase extradiol [Cytophagales bacterium]|nr:4,5-DOPA dioxygenase extradiol [Cytophagales bacterium]